MRKLITALCLSLVFSVNAGAETQTTQPKVSTQGQKGVFEQAYKPVGQAVNTMNGLYNFGKTNYQQLQNLISGFKNGHSVWGKISSGLGVLAKFGIIDQQSYSALSTIYQDVQVLLGLGTSFWPPKFYVGLPRDAIKLGKQDISIYNDVTKNVANLDGVNVNFPNYYLYVACQQGLLPEKFCQGADNPFVFVGKHGAKVVSEKTSKEIAKEVAQNVDSTAATSDVDQKNVSPQDEQKLDVLFNQRNVLMNGATFSYSALPIGKEYADKLPAALKPYYNAVAYQELMKDAYVKSLQRRLKLHYEKIIAFKHLIEQVCDAKVESPPPVCKGGGLLNNVLGGLSSVAGGNFNVSGLTNLQNLVGNLKNFGNGLTNLNQLANHLNLNYLPNVQNVKQLTNTVNSIKNKVSQGSGFLIQTRCCCAPCTPAVHAAEAHIQARLTAMETAIISSIQEAKTEIIQTIQTEGCLTRARLKMEFDLLRGQQKMFYCTLLRMKLAEMIMELDSLESQVATTSATLTAIQNQNYNIYNQEKIKLEKMGYELLKPSKKQ